MGGRWRLFISNRSQMTSRFQIWSPMGSDFLYQNFFPASVSSPSRPPAHLYSLDRQCVHGFIEKGAVQELQPWSRTKGSISTFSLWKGWLETNSAFSASQIRVDSFLMETPKSIHSALQSGDWVTTIDLKDVHLHIPIHPRFKRFSVSLWDILLTSL